MKIITHDGCYIFWIISSVTRFLLKEIYSCFPLSLEANIELFQHQVFVKIVVFKLLRVCFFITFVLSYGWTSLACELMPIFAIFYNLGKRFIPRIKDDSCNSTSSFPYHKEVPRLLFFGFLGFTRSILAPLVVSFVFIYFLPAYFVYRNQVSAPINNLSLFFFLQRY